MHNQYYIRSGSGQIEAVLVGCLSGPTKYISWTRYRLHYIPYSTGLANS